MQSSIYECFLPTEVQNFAEEVLHETEKNRKICFDELKEWAEKNKDLNVRIDEKYLIPFLRCCKFDVQRTKEKIKNFYEMRRDRTEWFTNRNPHLSAVQELMEMGTCIVLKETQDKQLVFIIRPTLPNPKKYNLDIIIKTALMLIDIAVMEEELAQVYGVIAIIDLTGVGFHHGKQLTVSRIRNLVHAWQNYHCRPKKIEFINAPLFVSFSLDIFKRFMTEKLRQRVHISYDGYTSLTNVIDRSILLEDYGGDGETMENLGNYWKDKLVSYANWFLEDEKFKAK